MGKGGQRGGKEGYGQGRGEAKGGQSWAAGGRSSPGSKGDGQSKGSGGKGGKTRSPWSFIPVGGAEDPLGLGALAAQIPEAWIDHQHGGRPEKDKLHVTFLLRMADVMHLERLERICSEAAPTVLEVSELFLERVDRIRDAEVYCIGVSFSSPGLRTLKEAWLQEEASDAARRVHNPYPTSDGHVSLAYVLSSAWSEANHFVRANCKVFDGQSLTVREIIYENEQREPMTLRFLGEGGGTASQEVMQIDGSVLEGGGQILRNSLAYSAILGYPVCVKNIRAKRKTPGLAAQHLECFNLVRDVSSAKLTGAKLQSCEVTFSPQKLRDGGYEADPKTAGAITLMVQASLFPLAFAGGTSEVNLKGGTDVDFSPPLDFLERVLAPSIQKMGVKLEVTCDKRGFFPKGGGSVNLFVHGLNEPLKPIVLAERGNVTKVEVICYATPYDGWFDPEEVRRVEDEFEPWLRDELSDKGAKAPKVLLRCEPAPPPDDRTNKAGCQIVVETSKGGLFHGSGAVQDGPKGARGPSYYEIWGYAAQEALGPLKAQLASGAAFDDHLVDQLILPASLAKGTSKLLAGKELSLHAQTAVFIAEQMVPGVKFRTTHPTPNVTLLECDGIGRSPGAAAISGPSQGSPANTVEALLAAGSLGGNPTLLADLKNDLSQFAAHFEVKAEALPQQDRIRVSNCATPYRAAECKAELEKILSFYGFSDVRWQP